MKRRGARAPAHGRRRFLAAALAAAAGAALPAALARLDPGAAANLAMRQPMLAERIAKLHAQIGQRVLAARSPRALAEAVRGFEEGLRGLAAAAGPEARESYALLALLWDEYRAIALRQATLENAKKLAERNEEIVWVATKGARQLVPPGATGRVALIRTAGEVRLLSQRIAKLHFYRHWGVRAEASTTAELRSAGNEYQLAMAMLRAAPLNTPEIGTEIVLADNQYLFLDQAVGRLRSGRDAPRELEFVAKTCDHILEVMERVARAYLALKD